MKNLLFVFSVLIFLIVQLSAVFAIEEKCNNPSALNLEEIEQCLPQLNKELDQLKTATKPLEGQLDSLNRQLTQIKSQLGVLSNNIQKKQTELNLREEKLVELTVIFNERVVEDYKNSYSYNPIGFIFGQSKLSDKLYHLKTINENREVIKNIGSEIVNVLTDKEKLEKDKVRMAALQKEVDKNAQFIGGEVKKSKVYQVELSGKISQLIAQQQQIIAQRLASLNISRSAASIGACSDDRHINPGFSSAFAFFTHGAPHRVGMNQFGAKGRAEAGQNKDDILKAYYTNFETVKWDTNTKIKVQGYGEFALEDYVLRIYEVPESWPMAALEAQAIAARSFALAYTNKGTGEICTSEQCQVFKPDPKTGQWVQAVKNTEGLVMTSGGNPIKAWYASTHGGYIFSSAEVWGGGTAYTKHATDTTSGSAGSFADLQSNAYDKSSPWFYCDWGSRAQFSKTAWLKSAEVADITNAVLLVKKDGALRDFVYQTDKPHPYGREVWNEDRVKQELRSRGETPFNSISSVSVGADFNQGVTTNVSVSGDAGSKSFGGQEFKDIFNVRAPANIQIVGPLFNVETR